MSAPKVLSELRAAGVRLRVEGERLLVDAPAGMLTEERKAEIRDHKEDLIALLRESASSRIPRRVDDGPARLSFAQQRLWFLDQIEPGLPVYNMPEAYRFRGPLDVAALERALNQVVARHDSLRTTFVLGEDGEPYQKIAARLELGLSIEELDHLAEADRESHLAARLEESSAEPFDLAEGPLVRARLFRLGPEDHVFFVNLHHTVSDGWSFEVMRRELAALYEAALTGGQPPLAPLPLQYVDFADWQRGWLEGGELERQILYWKEKLAGRLPVLELPADRPRPPHFRYVGSKVRRRISRRKLEELTALAGRYRSTRFMVMLAVYHALLHLHSGQRDLLVGSPIANRNHEELENTIGFFVNTLVLRTQIDPDGTFVDALRAVRETCLGAYSHQDIPLERLVEELQPERDLSRTPLFQTMLAFEDALDPEIESASGLRWSLHTIDTEVSRTDLCLWIREVEDGDALCILEYATDLFDHDRIERMLDQYLHLLDVVVRDPETPLRAAAVLGGEPHPAPERAVREITAPEPEPDVSESLSGAALHGPLIELWSEMLGSGPVGIHDEFFDVGGHSLLGLRVIRRVNQEFGVHLAPVTLFDHPTIARLASLIAADLGGGPSPAPAPERLPAAPVDVRPAAAPEPAGPDSMALADSDRVAAAIEAAANAEPGRSRKSFRMRRSWIARLLLAPLYRARRRRLREWLRTMIFRLEGGPLFSLTMRSLYDRYHEIEVGDYTTGGFNLGHIKPGTKIGRYSIVMHTSRFEVGNHPINTYSSNALFYRESFGFAEEFEIPRTSITIGSDVFVGHNATILYPCSEIGDGAVIGAHAVVDFDVPPFAVVSGNPGTIVRYRFSKKKIEELLRLRWWDAPLEALESVRDEFQRPVEGRRVR